MKKLYLFSFCLILLTSCSRDVFRRWDRRIIGTWTLVDVDSRGIGGDVFRLPFRDGLFQFLEDGLLRYTATDGTGYDGNWDISRQPGPNNQDYRPLLINAVAFTTGEIRSEHFHDMKFTGTNRFRAYIYSGAHVYVFQFRR